MKVVTAPDKLGGLIDAVPKQLLLGGTWCDAASGATFDVVDPATGDRLASLADAGTVDARAALDAAIAAQDAWGRTAPEDRAAILHRAFDIMTARTDELAAVMTLEMGKPLGDARGEVAYAAKFFRWFAEEAVRISGTHRMAPSGRNHILTVREPVGPSLLITPWNFPLAMGTRKIGPAIAAGCTMILKPAAQTPLSTMTLGAILLEAGLPAGVLSILPTSNPGAVVEPLLRSGGIRKMSFTGSTAVGRLLLEQAADAVVRTSMELGGNAPFIVFDDADLEVAVTAAVDAKMRNMGEACTAANRMFVHETIVEPFVARFTERMAALPVGNGLAEGTAVGPLIDQAAIDKVQRLVDGAVADGATVRIGGSRLPGIGHFYPPTVLTDVSPASEINGTEIFGPVASIQSFRDEEDVLRRANDTEWGLVGYVITTDLARATRVSGRLQVGMVGLNTGVVSDVAAPFGGVKQSGLGREGGHLGIDEYLSYKYLSIPASAPVPIGGLS
jgi:succinate-semialdehyde dehydrogenase/glutarate-semialdehyde dehydrogenase